MVIAPPGFGKTTLLSLIPRLFDATGGSVLVDGADVDQQGTDVVVEPFKQHRIRDIAGRLYRGEAGVDVVLFGNNLVSVSYSSLGAKHRLAAWLDAVVVMLNPPREVLVERAQQRDDPARTVAAIDQWLADYT